MNVEQKQSFFSFQSRVGRITEADTLGDFLIQAETLLARDHRLEAAIVAGATIARLLESVEENCNQDEMRAIALRNEVKPIAEGIREEMLSLFNLTEGTATLKNHQPDPANIQLMIRKAEGLIDLFYFSLEPPTRHFSLQ